MADANKRYPLSTAHEDSIPLEIVRPVSAVKKSFLSASDSTDVTVPATVEFFIALATEDCWIKFGASSATAAVPADGVITEDLFFLPAGMQMTVAPPIDKKVLSFIGDSANGTIYIQFLETWNALALQSQITRR